MRGLQRLGMLAMALGVAMAAAASSGCRTSTSSGLPGHIRTVEVHIFQNKTMHKGVEASLTRRLIDRINGDPRIRVVRDNGDAVITGEITAIRRSTLRETTTDEPGTVLITVEATYSFYDQVENRYLIEDALVRSTDTGMSPGIFEASRGDSDEEGERGAAMQAADEIVRRTIGMW